MILMLTGGGGVGGLERFIEDSREAIFKTLDDA